MERAATYSSTLNSPQHIFKIDLKELLHFVEAGFNLHARCIAIFHIFFPFANRARCPGASRAPATRSSLPTVCWTLQSAHWVECQLALEWLRLDHWVAIWRSLKKVEDQLAKWIQMVNPLTYLTESHPVSIQVHGGQNSSYARGWFCYWFFRPGISILSVPSCFDSFSELHYILAAADRYAYDYIAGFHYKQLRVIALTSANSGLYGILGIY